MSVRPAGIPKSTHSSPSALELISLSEALPMMGIALCCVKPLCKTTLEPLPCSEPAEEAISELSLCSELAKVVDFELSIRLVSSNVSGFELTVHQEDDGY